MSIIEGFERRALFNITRAVALVCVTVFLLVIAGGVIYAFSVWKERVSTAVTAKEIIDRIKPAEVNPSVVQPPQGVRAPTDQKPELSPLYGYRIPFVLQQYLSDSNAQILKSHLDNVPLADRQGYLDELGVVVTEADAQQIKAVDAINQFMQIKIAKYAESEVKTAQKWATLKTASEGVAGGLLLVALFSLVLVLLAIERNTRPQRVAAELPATAKREEALSV